MHSDIGRNIFVQVTVVKMTKMPAQPTHVVYRQHALMSWQLSIAVPALPLSAVDACLAFFSQAKSAWVSIFTLIV